MVSDALKTVEIGDYWFVARKDLPKILGVTRQTITSWIDNHVICKVRLEGMPVPLFELVRLRDQLNEYRKKC